MTSSGLEEDLNNLFVKPIIKCNIATILDSITEKEREVLQRLLDSNISADRIASVLKSNNFSASHSTVYRHRNKVCVCVGNNGTI